MEKIKQQIIDLMAKLTVQGQIQLKKRDKFEDGKKVGEHYAAVIITDRNGVATIHDSSEVDWRDIADCSTIAVDEIEIPIKK
jgi:hypothetical protein